MASVNVRGLRELELLAAAMGKKTERELRAGLREVAEPMRADAESLAASGIPRIGPKWSKMRVGVTRRAVYVAPRERGIKGRGPDPRRRPQFADLMEQRAMTPALVANTAFIQTRLEAVMQRLANEWNRS